jgi:hypothetical protein
MGCGCGKESFNINNKKFNIINKIAEGYGKI